MDRTLLTYTAVLLVFASLVSAHCQVPCGIYNDERRLDTMAEDVATIEKAIKQIESLSAAAKADYNQIVRWVNVKDEHADNIADIASWYFLQQRVKPVGREDSHYEAYMHQVTLLHEIMVHSMKTKQSLEMANVGNLEAALQAFRRAYLGEEGSEH
jgi:hypothetical protein